MKEILKNVVLEKGISILKSPSLLENELKRSGAKPLDIYSLQLVLAICPNLLSFAEKSISVEEEMAAVDCVCRNAYLSPKRTRELIAMILDAVHAKRDYRVRFLYYENKNGISGRKLFSTENLKIRAEVDSEEKTLSRSAFSHLVSPGAMSANYIDALNQLVQAGNGCACYQLGEHYMRESTEIVQSVAEQCFEHAAELGYAPAFGMLADLEIEKGGNMNRAARFFSAPGASGAGSRWTQCGEKLLAYREENAIRIQMLLFTAIVTFFFSCLMVWMAPGVWGVISVGLSALGIAVVLLTFVQKALYRSMVLPSCLLVICWLLSSLNLILL